MIPVENLTAESILEESIFVDLFDMKDVVEQTRRELELKARAKDLGVKTAFNALLKAYKEVNKHSNPIAPVAKITDFDSPYHALACGTWIANDRGIFTVDARGNIKTVCYHPILPLERMKNLETGEEQIKIAFRRNGNWSEIIVKKHVIATASRIVELSNVGVAVNSENAKLLVQYLADLENMNDMIIPIKYSTSKLGWIKDSFLPYDDEIRFDGNSRFGRLFECVTCHGNPGLWMEHIKELRKTGRIELKFLLAASFASVLIHPLGALPFFVDLWGETEGGKTVSLMVAASIWADPDENRYIGDFKSTEVALEARADMLNHLPMLLDDTSKTSVRIRDNFESIVYDLCSGKGKSRSNKYLGVNRENYWKNIIICNGERPLSGYVQQGGAINRILEIPCGERVYAEPFKTIAVVKNNYGHAGKLFVAIIREIGEEKLRNIFSAYQETLHRLGKMQKQANSLAIILTADKIATDHIFKDNEYISIDEAVKTLVDRNDISDNERCYRYLIDKVSMNSQRFDNTAFCEQWGVLEEAYVIFFKTAFDQICKDGGFSSKAFLNWAEKNKLLKSDPNRQTKVKKIGNKTVRSVYLLLDKGTSFGEEDPLDGNPFESNT